PAEDGSKVEVRVDPNSERLQLLAPFAPPRAEEYEDMPLLVKTPGKTTTDHISPAGPWLRFRGHLARISDNMLTAAGNAFGGKVGHTKNAFSGEEQPIPAVAREYKAKGLKWVVVGDENYGEGSSREHAAMSPRYLGAGAIIVRSFARIHETNLKKQGVLPFTFADPADYEKVREGDRITLVDVFSIEPGKQVQAVLHHADGSEERIDRKSTRLNSSHV